MSRREDLERTLRELMGVLEDQGKHRDLPMAMHRARRTLDPPASEYPEHDKLSRVGDRTQAVGDFLEWVASERGAQLCSFVDGADRFLPLTAGRDQLLGAWVEVDPIKLEDEKRAMLNEIRNRCAP